MADEEGIVDINRGMFVVNNLPVGGSTIYRAIMRINRLELHSAPQPVNFRALIYTLVFWKNQPEKDRDYANATPYLNGIKLGVLIKDGNYTIEQLEKIAIDNFLNFVVPGKRSMVSADEMVRRVNGHKARVTTSVKDDVKVGVRAVTHKAIWESPEHKNLELVYNKISYEGIAYCPDGFTITGEWDPEKNGPLEVEGDYAVGGDLITAASDHFRTNGFIAQCEGKEVDHGEEA